MHGGGGPRRDEHGIWENLSNVTASNDEEWERMMGFYNGQISRGIYVALRGVGDSWDMHFTAVSYILLERLIENLILFAGVDPNHVSLIGFSAGVYRLAPRLAQRFNAANMGGGHPGGVHFENLMNLPICLQIGEQDNREVKDRSKHVAESGKTLDILSAKYPGTNAYEHNVFIHPTPDGNYSTRHFMWKKPNVTLTSPNSPRINVPIVHDWRAWLDSYFTLAPQSNITQVNTNAVDWVSSPNRVRNPIPQHVFWDLRDGDNFNSDTSQSISGRGEDGAGRSQNYWLDIGKYFHANVGDTIEAKLDTSGSNNTVVVASAKKYLRILLQPGMLNLSRPIAVSISGQTLTITVNNDNPAVVQDTLWRNDPYFIFTSDIVLVQGTSGQWTTTSTAKPSATLRARL